MREMKFRGWNGKRMTRAYTLNEMMVEQLEFNGLKENWMQYTGLKDKNGKEIYEGDVVQSKAWHSDADGRCVLSDANSYIRKKLVEYSTKEPFVGFSIPSKCEVIGNIYENPELLTDK